MAKARETKILLCERCPAKKAARHVPRNGRPILCDDCREEIDREKRQVAYKKKKEAKDKLAALSETTDDKINKLMKLCRCSFSVEVNNHKTVYETAGESLSNLNTLGMSIGTDNAVIEEMIKRDRIVTVRAYPSTPVGFYVVYHYDLNSALTEVIRRIKEDF